MKVLVFCQRKKSFEEIDNYKVDYVVNKLEKFILDNYENEYENISFEYLTEGRIGLSPSLYEADYKMSFNIFNNRSNTLNFISTHIEDYDMIILQTCPLLLVIKQLPYLFKTLKKNGKLLFTNFSYNNNELNILNEDIILPFVGNILNNNFIKAEKDFTEFIKYQ